MDDAMDLSKGASVIPCTYAELPGKCITGSWRKRRLVMLIEGNGPFDVQFDYPEDDPTKKTAIK